MRYILSRIKSWLSSFWSGIKGAIDGKPSVRSGSGDNTNQNR